MTSKSETALTRKEGEAEVALRKEMPKGFEVVQTGGITKWVDMKKFQLDEKVGQNQPVKANGKYILGMLIGMDEIEDDKAKEGIRFFYSIRLKNECPVSYKDDNQAQIEEIAQPGEIVAIGERSKLSMLSALVKDGGEYEVLIQPHSRIKISGGQTMWTFNVGKNVIKPPAILNVQPKF